MILINRVQHIVIPPRAPLPDGQHGHDADVFDDHDLSRTWPAQALSAINAVRRRVLPISVKRTHTRLAIMLPALMHSSWTLTLLLVSMLEVTKTGPSFPPSSSSRQVYDFIVNRGLQMDMYAICWMAFMSACFLSASGALLAGLEGQ